MKILLAPSEGKKQGGISANFDISKLAFDNILHHDRETLIKEYQRVINSGNRDIKIKIFGIKKEDIISRYESIDILDSPLLCAIKRYDGVAFDYLDYESLSNSAKEYLDRNLLIFSNLFGILRASDMIPDYRVKQGANIGEYLPQKLYAKSMQELDREFEDEEILDIRAGFYDKFYKPKKNYATLKFLKNGRVVSHWAKAFRGIVLREVATNNIETLREFEELSIDGLRLIEIQHKKSKIEYIYEIGDI